jgi:hypothetical protein
MLDRARQQGLQACHAGAAPRRRREQRARHAGGRVALGPSRGRARRARCRGEPRPWAAPVGEGGGRGGRASRRGEGVSGELGRGHARQGRAKGVRAGADRERACHVGAARRAVRAGRARGRAAWDTRATSRAPWPSSDRVEPRAIRSRVRETREGRDEGGEAHRKMGAERMDATATVLGDESDGERRKKRHVGEGDEQGTTSGLTGGAHMQRRWLPKPPPAPAKRARRAHALAAGPRRVGPPRLRPKTRRRRGERGKQVSGGAAAGRGAPGRPTTRGGAGGPRREGPKKPGLHLGPKSQQERGGFEVFSYFPYSSKPLINEYLTKAKRIHTKEKMRGSA